MRSRTTWIFAIATSALLTLHSASARADDQGLQAAFERGRTLAARVVQQVTRCQIALNQDRAFFDTLTNHGADIAQDLTASRFVWDDDWEPDHSQSSCAWTIPESRSPIYLSDSYCGSVTSEIMIAELLLHEAFHHMGVTDETTARRNASKVFRVARSGVCGDILPHDDGGDNDGSDDGREDPIPLPNRQQPSFVAIAVNPHTSHMSLVNDARTAEEAESMAMRYCGDTSCRLVAATSNQCVIVGYSRIGAPDRFETQTLDWLTREPLHGHFLPSDIFGDAPEEYVDYLLTYTCSLQSQWVTDHDIRIYDRRESDYVAIAFSQGSRRLFSANGANTRYDAEQAAIDKCRQAALSDCRVVGSAHGQDLEAELSVGSARVFRGSRVEWVPSEFMVVTPVFPMATNRFRGGGHWTRIDVDESVRIRATSLRPAR